LLFNIYVGFLLSTVVVADVPIFELDSSSSSSAHDSPLLDIGLSNFSPSRSILGYSHPAPASRPAQIITPPGLRASHTSYSFELDYMTRFLVVLSIEDLSVINNIDAYNVKEVIGHFGKNVFCYIFIQFFELFLMVYLRFFYPL
jgi:hypothetical protein